MKNYDIDIQMIFFFWIEINLFYNSNCDRMRQLISTDHVENFLQFIRWRVSVFPGKSPALNPTWNSYFFFTFADQLGFIYEIRTDFPRL